MSASYSTQQTSVDEGATNWSERPPRRPYVVILDQLNPSHECPSGSASHMVQACQYPFVRWKVHQYRAGKPLLALCRVSTVAPIMAFGCLRRQPFAPQATAAKKSVARWERYGSTSKRYTSMRPLQMILLLYAPGPYVAARSRRRASRRMSAPCI